MVESDDAGLDPPPLPPAASVAPPSRSSGPRTFCHTSVSSFERQLLVASRGTTGRNREPRRSASRPHGEPAVESQELALAFVLRDGQGMNRTNLDLSKEGT